MPILGSPHVSVIIPSYNRAALLPRALESVARQTYQNFEVLVIDDGSTDDTAKILPIWAEKMNLKWTSSPQRGVSAARNAGVAVSSGIWLAFLDSDDEWCDDKLERQLAYAARFPSLSLIHGEEIWIRQGVRVNPAKKYRKSGGWIFPQALELCCISPSAVMIKKDYFLKFGGFREDFPVCEDYDLWLKMTGADPVGFIEEPLVTKYGGREDQLSNSTPAMDFYRVRAIDDILASRNLPGEWKSRAVEVLNKKCDILLKGYVKHNNMSSYEGVKSIKEKWATLTAI